MKFHWAYVIILATVIISVACKKQSSSNSILVYGHGGTTIIPERWVYPPNTVASIEYALNVLNADGVEVDVQMSKDSVLFLYHDQFLTSQTSLSGCVVQYLSTELIEANVYQSKYTLDKLITAFDLVLPSGKFMFLDLKPYNFCDQEISSHQLFANSLQKEMNKFSDYQKSQIVCNARDIDLLKTIKDTVIIKCFETEDIDLGENYFINGFVDELCIKFQALNDANVAYLHDKQIPFSIFGIRSEDEIKKAISFKPIRIITDNIAYTNKKLKYE